MIFGPDFCREWRERHLYLPADVLPILASGTELLRLGAFPFKPLDGWSNSPSPAVLNRFQSRLGSPLRALAGLPFDCLATSRAPLASLAGRGAAPRIAKPLTAPAALFQSPVRSGRADEAHRCL